MNAQVATATASDDAQVVSESIYRQSPLTVRPLTPALGLEVSGLGAIDGLPAWLSRSLQQLWGEHGVLLFRGLTLDEEQQVAFSRIFGELEVHGQVALNSRENPELMYLTNRKDLGLPEYGTRSSELAWHSDQVYLPRPALGSLLYSVQVPDEGGDTYWADMRTAYDRLPEATKQRIDGLVAVFDYSISLSINNFSPSEVQKKRSALIERHPLVRTHPITLRKSLYLSPQTTSHIEGLSPDESRRLLDELLEATIQPDLVYRHKWRVGDAIVWDNARVIHRRDTFSDAQPRFMRRTTISAPAEVSIPF